jgi:Tfp pilus assembly protein PilN
MIRINLLESITDKPTSTIVAVEKKVSNPVNRFYLLAAIVGGLLILGIGFDYLYATVSKYSADSALAEQQKIAAELETVMKEQAELDRKIKDVDDRINAIKNLRASQAGPSAVLEALRERIINSPGLYLETVEQKGELLTIKGNSPNEFTVSDFGKSLEFSSGLFSNLNIELNRKALEASQVQSADGKPVQLGTGEDKPAPETVNFTIRCAYTPSKAANQSPLPNRQQQSAPVATKTAGQQTAAVTSAVKTAQND